MGEEAVLKGRKILITRPEEQAASWAEKLRQLGALPQLFPLIEIVPIKNNPALREAVRNIHNYDLLVFASSNAARCFFENGDMEIILPSGRPEVAAVGPATARYLKERGINVRPLPKEYTASALAASLGKLQGKKILLPNTTLAREELGWLLGLSGAEVEVLRVYETRKRHDPEKLADILKQGIDILTFASPSAVESFVEQADYKKGNFLIACIGPVTAERAMELGLQVDITAHPHTADGMTEAIITYYNQHGKTKKT
jgi:uroporphyrinogen-III synthase